VTEPLPQDDEDEEVLRRLRALVLVACGDALRLAPAARMASQHRLPAKFFAEDVDAASAGADEKLLFLLNHLCPIVAAPEEDIAARRAWPSQAIAHNIIQK